MIKICMTLTTSRDTSWLENGCCSTLHRTAFRLEQQPFSSQLVSRDLPWLNERLFFGEASLLSRRCISSWSRISQLQQSDQFHVFTKCTIRQHKVLQVIEFYACKSRDDLLPLVFTRVMLSNILVNVPNLMQEPSSSRMMVSSVSGRSKV